MFNRKLPKDVSDFRDEYGSPIHPVRSKRKQRGLALSEEAYAGLQMLARLHNDYPDFGHQNSVSDLLERIGNFELLIVDPKKSPSLAEASNQKADILEQLKERMSDNNSAD